MEKSMKKRLQIGGGSFCPELELKFITRNQGKGIFKMIGYGMKNLQNIDQASKQKNNGAGLHY